MLFLDRRFCSARTISSLAKTVEMLVHSITAAKNVHANAASDASGSAQASLSLASKRGPKRKYTDEERRVRRRQHNCAYVQRKKEAHAALEIRAQKAEDELKSARTKISQLVACLTFATSENIKLRAQLEGREVDEMVAELQAQIPRADLQGEGAVD